MNKSEKPEGDKNKRVISSIRKSQNEKDLKLNIFTNGDKSKNIYV